MKYDPYLEITNKGYLTSKNKLNFIRKFLDEYNSILKIQPGCAAVYETPDKMTVFRFDFNEEVLQFMVLNHVKDNTIDIELRSEDTKLNLKINLLEKGKFFPATVFAVVDGEFFSFECSSKIVDMYGENVSVGYYDKDATSFLQEQKTLLSRDNFKYFGIVPDGMVNFQINSNEELVSEAMKFYLDPKGYFKEKKEGQVNKQKIPENH